MVTTLQKGRSDHFFHFLLFFFVCLLNFLSHSFVCLQLTAAAAAPVLWSWRVDGGPVFFIFYFSSFSSFREKSSFLLQLESERRENPFPPSHAHEFFAQRAENKPLKARMGFANIRATKAEFPGKGQRRW